MIPWLVVACPGSRTDELVRCLGSLQHPPEHTVIVTAANFDGITDWTPFNRGLRIFIDYATDFSLPRLWNLGLRDAYDDGATHVAVLASDICGHPGSIPTLAAAMATQGWVMAGPTLHGGPTRTLRLPRTPTERVPGACFMLDARHRLLCDDAYRWWYSEDQLEVDARKLGPVGVVDGTGLELSKPDAGLDTPEKQQWADEDRAYFVEKNGCEPW